MKKKRPIQRYVPKQHLRPRPIDLRRETQQRVIATFLLLGWSVARIARKLHCSDRAIRWRMDQEEFQKLFDGLQREHFQRVHRKLGSLLHGAVDTLERLLKHSDWRARNAALEHIFKIHGKYVERFDITGQLEHVRPVVGELVDDQPPWSDEMRDKARELLRLQRQMFQRSLPARLASRDQDQHDPVNGRFMSQSDDEQTR
jgi:hypothetical protein